MKSLACKLALLLALVGCALAAPAAAAERTVGRNALERSVLAEINELRAANGMRPLRLSAQLNAAADAHSRAMLSHGFFAHASADGTSFWQRIRRWYRPSGRRHWAVGENLVWSSPDLTAERAVQMWLASPPHRKNLLTPAWREIGLSAVHAASAAGVFGGSEVTVMTADFGVRS